jgi:AraC-like DNA-binding protein
MPGPGDREFITQLGPPMLAMLKPEDAAALVSKHGLPADAAGRRELAMPLKIFHQLTAEATALLGDVSLGVRLAHKAPRGSYGALEFTLLSSPSIREALVRLNRYSALLNGLVRFSVDVVADEARFTQRVDGMPLVNGRVGNEFSIALTTRVLTGLSGKAFTPREVWFGHPRPADVSELEKAFGTRALAFDRGENGFSFDAAFLELPVVTADPNLLPLVEDQARRLALSRQAASDFPGEVREQTRKLLQSSSLGVAEVAKSMGLSQRTLQRRLGEHGTTFFAVLDALREGLAREYVPDPKLVLGEVAYLLGYSDLSAFVRSFKRWTGKTPGEYRKGR